MLWWKPPSLLRRLFELFWNQTKLTPEFSDSEKTRDAHWDFLENYGIWTYNNFCKGKTKIISPVISKFSNRNKSPLFLALREVSFVQKNIRNIMANFCSICPLCCQFPAQFALQTLCLTCCWDSHSHNYVKQNYSKLAAFPFFCSLHFEKIEQLTHQSTLSFCASLCLEISILYTYALV